MQILKERSFQCGVLASFAFGFLFIYLSYVGLPVDFTADHVTNVNDTQAFRYTELLKLTLNPTTPAWFYPGSHSMAYLRPFHFFIMKLYFNSFHYSLSAFHVTAAIGNGILGVVLFTFIHCWTRNILLSLLGIVFYSSLPSNYFTMSSTFSMDVQHFINLLTLTSLACFGWLTYGRHKSKGKQLLLFLGWILTTWIVIKMKSSEKLIPFICGGFFVVRFKYIISRIGKGYSALIPTVLCLMMFLVVPLKSIDSWITDQGYTVQDSALDNSNDKDKTALSFKWQHLVQRTFYVPGGQFPFTTVFKDEIPRSFSENYGFFLAWFYWLSFLLFPVMLAKIRKGKAESSIHERVDVLEHFLLLFLVWFAATVAGFGSGLDVNDTRFLNFAYIPSLFLLFLFITMWRAAFFNKVKARSIYTTVITLIILLSSSLNYIVFAKMLGHFGGMQHSVVEAEKDVYRDYFGQEPGRISLYEQHFELESRAVFIDWYEHSPDWLKDVETQIKQEGILYFYTRSVDSERLQALKAAGYSANEWKRYNFLDAKPKLFKLFKGMIAIKNATREKKKTPREIIIYRIS